MTIHVYDGDSWSKHPDLVAAEAACRVSLDAAREQASFDREWPEWVEDIRAYEGPDDVECPAELPCVLRAIQINIQTPSSELDENGYDSDYEWWESQDASRCDYDIAKPESV